MILIGTMNLTRTRERGDFFCPTCATPQTYRLRARRPFLTIYFIPTVPIGAAELFVQCDRCRSSWDTSVLTLDQAAHEQVQAEQFRDEAIRAAVLMTLEDDKISENEVQTLIHIADLIFDRSLDREELGRLCSIARQSGIRTSNYVLTVSRRWTTHQRLFALQALFLVATASEEKASTKKLAVLAQMRDVMQLTDREYKTAIDDAIEYQVA